MRFRNSGATVVLCSALLACWIAPSTAGAERLGERCAAPVVLVHDAASNATEWDLLRQDPRGAGECVFAISYGATALTDAFGAGRLGGTAAIEDSARQFAGHVDDIRSRTGSDTVRVIARGAGGLVAAYYLQHLDARFAATGRPSIDTLVTLGPLWGGTDVAYLSTIADINKRNGLYEPLRALEDPFVGPTCPGCRQLIRRSDFMNTFADDGGLPVGPRYVNIISRSDTLMSDPLSAAVTGTESVVLQDMDPANRSNHFELAIDPLARSLALDAM
jgi:pimeloyl-ACP methyl ester carboxylesterase